MHNFIVLCSWLFGGLVLVCGNSDDMIGPGKWNVINIKKSDGDYKFIMDISQRKVNRTHDGFNANIELKEDFDDSFGVYIDISKRVDGGWKKYQLLSDESIMSFMKKYAEDNFKVALTMAGIDPPEFPVPKGEYQINNYIFDYKELPQECMYGEYFADACIVKGQIKEGCVEVVVEFIQHDDEDEDDD